MSEREKVLREAIKALHKVGLKIESLAAHPEIFCEIANETSLALVWKIPINPEDYPQHTYCGIPIHQVQNREQYSGNFS